MSDNDWERIATNFDNLRNKYFSSNLPEIHAKDLFNGRAPFDTVDGASLIRELTEFIRDAHTTLFGIAINKVEFCKFIGSPDQIVHRSLEEMVNRYHEFLSRHHSSGIIVSDVSERASDTRIRELYEYFRRQGTHFLQIKKIIDTIFFTPSETAVGIQMADVVAYAIKRHCEDHDDRIWSMIDHKFDRTATGSHGFREIPDPLRKRRKTRIRTAR